MAIGATTPAWLGGPGPLGLAWCAWVAALSVGLAAALLMPPARARVALGRGAVGPVATSDGGGDGGSDGGWMRRWRWLLALLAAAGAESFLGGPLGAVLAPAAAVATWVLIGRIEPPAARRVREQVARELPHVVRLLGAALTSGAPPAEALEVVADALPGPAGERLRPVVLRLRLGADPASSWAGLGTDPALAPLARALSRAEDGGISVAATVTRLADDLAREARSQVEQRARAVGVKAAAPLGLCLLPAFLLIGIVPLVGGLLTSLSW